MGSFLEDTVRDIYQTYGNFDHIVFVLPNKRSGIYLKKYLSQHLKNPIFSPSVYSIEELITSISAVQKASTLQLLFELYEAQTFQSKTEENAFEVFSNWAITLLSDFNEIDSNLADYSALFKYLTEAKRIQHWELKDRQPTKLISESLKFWENLEITYTNLKYIFAEKHIGYQGHIYKNALQHLEDYVQDHKDNQFVFIGFNALTRVEESIVQYFLANASCHIYWDVDKAFIMDPIHEAGYFIRTYLTDWPYFQNLAAKGISNHFLAEKQIEIVGIPKQIAQAKYIGQLLLTIYSRDSSKNVALILPDESLLPAILNSIPEQVTQVNITMGLPLKDSGLYTFFKAFIDLQLNSTDNGWYHRHVLNILSNPFASLLLRTNSEDGASLLRRYIKNSNLIYIRKSDVAQIIKDPLAILDKLFPDQYYSNSEFVETCLQFVHELGKNMGNVPENAIDTHALSNFYQVFYDLSQLLNENRFLRSLKSLKIVFDELIKSAKIHFRGDPLGGLQIMGMLESRNLDFETVIIASVNEGILPAGKIQNSHIPFDIKKEYGIPSYKEKDAVYAYHFYRLLQRANTVYLTYNTEPDVLLGNEPSRFIKQLLTDQNIAKFVRHKLATPRISIENEGPRQLHKTPLLLRKLKVMAKKGFSPTALSNYIRNPYDFYKTHILQLDDVADVEESIAHNTFGTIVHDTLEELYLPFVGKRLYPNELARLKDQLPSVVRKHFKVSHAEKGIDTGKNHIAYQVILRYLELFLDFDSNRANASDITILAIEEKRTATLKVAGLHHPIVLKGKIDRIELVNGKVYLLDYKTGRVSPSDLDIRQLQDLTTEKGAKAFQLLCYSLLLREDVLQAPIRAGIIPLKFLTQGILYFNQKSNTSAKDSERSIDITLINQFELLLAQLIQEIFDPSIPFEDAMPSL